MDIPNRIVAMVHDRVGEALASILSGGDRPFFIKPTDTLIAQLEDPKVTVPRVSAGFVGDIAVTSVSGVVSKLRSLSEGIQSGVAAGEAKLADAGELLTKVRNSLRGQLPFFPKLDGANAPGGVVENLVGLLDNDPRDIGQAAEAFHGRVKEILQGLVRPGRADDDDASVGRLRQILGNDVGTIMPLAAIANAMRRAKSATDVPHSIERGLLVYFFSSEGYQTLDGESVVAPVHLSDLKSVAAGILAAGPGLDVKINVAAPVKQLKGLITTATAEQYLRDTIRVIVESTYDVVRGFRDTDGARGRFGVVTTKLKERKETPADQEAIVTKFVTWFRGFSSMAESGAMRAVEMGTQGVSEFQTNPLIAAAAGAFAGTVARKLAQDSFLDVLSTELKIT
jgi:hypothetical protein